jgi:alpha-glucosidase
LFLAPCLWLASNAAAQTSYSLRSPDKKIEVRIRAGSRMQYDVLRDGKILLQDSALSIRIDQATLGRDVKVKSARERSADRVLDPPVRQKFAHIRDHYNELRLDTEDGLAVVFRAYNEGVAYRLETVLPKAQVKVYGEEAVFQSAANQTVFYPEEEGNHTPKL